LEGYSFRHPVKDYSLSGAYRHIVAVPKEFSHQVQSYTNEKVSLIRSDADILQGVDPLPHCVDGAKRALILNFTLPPSTYATMLVREVIKIPTDSYSMTAMNPNGTVRGFEHNLALEDAIESHSFALLEALACM
jgi:tRNA pseudouridine13 synthase